MDRCRCDEYSAAVKKLKFYTVGTFRPDIIDKYDKSGYHVNWIKHSVDYCDMKFTKPRAVPRLPPEQLPENILPKDTRLVEQMWCPYMTPYKLSVD